MYLSVIPDLGLWDYAYSYISKVYLGNKNHLDL